MSEPTEKYTVRPSSVISMTVEDRDKLVADTRREAWEEACKAVCDTCYAMPKNPHITLEYNEVYHKFEHTYRYKIGTFEEFSGHEDCKATPIRKLMERG